MMEPMAAAPKLGYRPELDGLRGVAVLAVVCQHWGIFAALGFAGGWVGVDVFFVLSGFLITTLLCEELAATGTVSLRGFYVRRARRLLPALAVFLPVCVAWAMLAGGAMRDATLKGVVHAGGYVANFLGTGNYQLDLTSHLWSLSVEEHFYLVWPAVFLVAARLWGERALLSVTLVGAAGSVALRVAGTEGPTQWTHYRADALLVGCAVALLLRRGIRLDHAGPLGAVWLVGVLVAGEATAWVRWGYTVNALAAAVVIAMVLRHPGRLTDPALVKIGVLSYGIYLWHNAIKKAVWSLDVGAWPTPARLAVLVALTGCVTHLSYVLVESRFRSHHRRDDRRVETPVLVQVAPAD